MLVLTNRRQVLKFGILLLPQKLVPILCFRQISHALHATIATQSDKKGENAMLGIRIAILRISKGWSQAELARRIGVSTSAVGMYEQGRREPSLGLLVRLAQEFGVTTDYLLMGETPASDPLTASELPSITVRTEALIRLLSRTMK